MVGMTSVILLPKGGVVMKTRKTAISLPEDTFLQAAELARRLGMKRSQLISAALKEYLERHREDRITEVLNDLYAREASDTDPLLERLQFSSLSREDW
jgi:metal-responsive CopG/Arc/MetJ family transcriptional regulator